MNIDSSLIKNGSSRPLVNFGNLQNSLDDALPVRQRRHHQVDADKLRLSDAGKLAQTNKLPLEADAEPNAEHQLSMQIVSQLFKQVTGQDLAITTPDQLPNQATGATAQLPGQAPVPASANQPANGLNYQLSQTYLQTQRLTFSAEGLISTKDGQGIKFSVSLSMSQLFFSQTNVSANVGPGKQSSPLQVSYNGMAAELTSTEFSFSIDQGGSADHIALPSSPANAPSAPALAVQSERENDQDQERDTQKPGDLQQAFASLAQTFFKSMRLWQHQQDGSQLLLALGDQKLGSVYVGHLGKPLATESTQTNDTNLVNADAGLVLPHAARMVPSATNINLTA